MLNESHNNSSDWKNRLEALDGLPGETFNKAAVWEKLHQRLGEKPAGKKAVWYLSAAACLLLAFFMSWLFLDKKEISMAKNNMQPKQTITSPTYKEKDILKKDTLKVERRIYAGRKQRSSFIAKMNTTTLSANDTAIISKPVLSDIVTSQINLPQVANNVILADTSHNTFAKVTYRQKLRVIHINELSQPIEEVRFVLNEGVGFPIKITNKDIFSRPSAGNRAQHDILKIHLSPQN